MTDLIPSLQLVLFKEMCVTPPKFYIYMPFGQIKTCQKEKRLLSLEIDLTKYTTMCFEAYTNKR